MEQNSTNYQFLITQENSIVAWSCVLFEKMIAEIGQCRLGVLITLGEIEHCFQIGYSYWSIVKNAMEKYVFEDVMEEIIFFKTIKPLFMGEIEYFGLRYHAQLFQQGETVEDFNKFWDREMTRLDKFIGDNLEFYNYYTMGKTNMDEHWFTRKNANNVFSTPKIYDLCDNVRTSHDHLVTTLRALEKYVSFIKTEKRW